MDLEPAKLLGVSRSTLYRWRKGATQPSWRMRDLMTGGTPFESQTWVRAARQELGLGQAEFGRLCGVTQACVSKWENRGLALEREDASELFLVLQLPPALNPASPEPCQSEEEATERYAAHSSSLIIQSRADADWRAAQFCSSLADLANHSVETSRILAATHANRSLWHLVHQDLRHATHHAKVSIRLGRRHGFDLESGYALWSLARTRFLPGFGSKGDLDLLDRELNLAESKGNGLPPMYVALLRGARAIAQGDARACATEFSRAQERAPRETEGGVVSRWGESYWRRDIAMYSGMLALCSGRYAECCRVVEPIAHEPFDSSVARQYGQTVARHYLRAARARLGSREAVETDGPLLSPRVIGLIKRHTGQLSGIRPVARQ